MFLEGDSGSLIAAFVDIKGACSWRFYRFESGSFIRKSRADGSFRTAFTRTHSQGLGIQTALPAGSGYDGNAGASPRDCQRGKSGPLTQGSARASHTRNRLSRRSSMVSRYP
jgi:hypothetical protein